MSFFVGLGFKDEFNHYFALLEEDDERSWFAGWLHQGMLKSVGISIYLVPAK